jgi:hypothetical protein
MQDRTGESCTGKADTKGDLILDFLTLLFAFMVAQTIAGTIHAISPADTNRIPHLTVAAGGACSALLSEAGGTGKDGADEAGCCFRRD